jgi:hypothetical protein
MSDIPRWLQDNPADQSLYPVFQEPYRLPQVRPDARGGCSDMPRPCPFVTCRHHVFDHEGSKGSEGSFGGETCTLDVADRGEHSYEQIAQVLQMTEAQIKQIETSALRRLRHHGLADKLVELQRGFR